MVGREDFQTSVLDGESFSVVQATETERGGSHRKGKEIHV